MGIKDVFGDIAEFITGGASSVIETVGNIIDKLSTTDEEKQRLKNVLIDKMNSFVLEVLDRQSKEQEELTKRLEADMNSDSFLAKNIRPMTLIYILFLLTIIIILNALRINIDETYSTILKIWGGLAFSFYFGSRWNEKITRIKKQ